MAASKRRHASVDGSSMPPPPSKRRSSNRLSTAAAAAVDPDVNSDILDGPNATRASPDSAPNGHIVPNGLKGGSESPLSDAPDVESPSGLHVGNITAAVPDASVTKIDRPGGTKARGKKKIKEEPDDNATQETADATASPEKKIQKKSNDDSYDPEADGDEEADPEEMKQALTRPPPINSDYLPLPWKGRLGYACLNTYLRASNPPVFSSRTCRIQSILEHRHPLRDPTQPEHATKNRPDKTKPADVELGMRYLESICLANVQDIGKMIRWNDRYGIKFLRLSSEMFPFASHPEYGYELAPFAADALAEAGKVIAHYGHRVTTHPGQFTQLGSPRKQVNENAIRDLKYHDEMLSLLKLPEQLNRDAVMILHMGGLFEGKEPTLDRFRENYARLPQSVKNRLVLENDDVIWNVHDLLPVCEELNIPMVLDFHHHNIVFAADKLREGTKDIMDLYPRILATWKRKGITPKMHYSEPTPAAITPRQRRKHNPRVATLPPCPPDMDLMIEAKDKEQAVFELMRTFKLPGWDTFNDVIPYVREDDNKIALQQLNKKKKKTEEPEPTLIDEADVGMGGPQGRVYWPPGMEEWLRPKKREVKKKEPSDEPAKTKAQIKKEAEALYAARQAADAEAEDDVESDENATPATKKAKAAMRKKDRADKAKAAAKAAKDAAKDAAKLEAKTAKQRQADQPASAVGEVGGNGKKRKAAATKRGPAAVVPTPSPSGSASASISEEPDEPDVAVMGYGDDDAEEEPYTPAPARRARPVGARKSGRANGRKRVNYVEDADELLE